MSALAILQSLWPSIRDVLGVLGRWVVTLVGRRGREAVATYLEMRTEVFQTRRARSRTTVRKRWLAGRIRRWNAAAAWLRGPQGRKLQGKVVDLAIERARQELPERGAGESFRPKRCAA